MVKLPKKKLWQSIASFGSIVCASDPIAIGVVNFLNQQKITLGTDLTLVSFDDLNVISYLTPSPAFGCLKRKSGKIQSCNSKHGHIGCVVRQVILVFWAKFITALLSKIKFSFFEKVLSHTVAFF